MEGKPKTGEQKSLPRINFRPFVVAAMSLLSGIFLYIRIRFGGIMPSDFIFLVLFFALLLVPFSKKRILAVLLALLVFGGAGAGLMHWRTERYLGGPEAGNYTVTGTVVSFTVESGATDVILDSLSFDGASVGGKLSVRISSEKVRAGDIVTFQSKIRRSPLPKAGNNYGEYLFSADIRYASSTVGYEKVGTSKNFLLLVDSALYDRLIADMGGAEAQVAYALLTGNSQSMDEGLLGEVRRGGIAHIFAVSGLHIGILFSVVLLLGKRLKQFACLPAIGVALLYTAFCSFTISSVRALIMCAVLGITKAFYKKYDFLESVSTAALLILLVDPASWLSTGFRLSFGACVGIALFSGSFSRTFKRIPHLPKVVANYFAANLAVQLFTIPILLESFGYFSVWGFLLNLFLVPLLPVFFLAVFLFALLALCIPPAGFVFLVIPKGLLSLFLLLFAAGDFTLAVTGFSLGAGATMVWLVACLVLSERVRLRPKPRAIAGGCLALLFVFFVVSENVVFTGGRVVVYSNGNGNAALVQTRSACVLVIDGKIGFSDCEDFLAHRHLGKLDAVIVLSDDELSAINRAAFLDTKEIYAKDEVTTGFHGVPVTFCDRVEVGGLEFRYVTREKLALIAEDVVIEFDFENNDALGADFFVHSDSGGLIFSFNNGIIRAL